MFLLTALFLLIFFALLVIGMFNPRLVIPFRNSGRAMVLLFYLTPILLIVGLIGYFLQGKDTSMDDPEEVIYLNLYDRGLSALPENLEMYVNLRELNLKNNRITDLDESTLRELKNLKFLNLHNNPVRQLPDWLGELGLEELVLDGTEVEYIPEKIRSGIPKISYEDTPLERLEKRSVK